jgi:hypothetical protein
MCFARFKQRAQAKRLGMLVNGQCAKLFSTSTHQEPPKINTKSRTTIFLFSVKIIEGVKIKKILHITN